MRPALLALFAAALTSFAQAQPAQHQSVLLISVDGMRPDYVTQADQHRLRIPTLRRIMAQGAYAEGVQGVFPTVTYPSHTTLVTGVAPRRARHRQQSAFRSRSPAFRRLVLVRRCHQGADALPGCPRRRPAHRKRLLAPSPPTATSTSSSPSSGAPPPPPTPLTRTTDS